MNLNSPNRRKIAKIAADIEQLEKNIEESKKKLSTLKAAKIEAENTEIISLVRNAELSIDDIAELISDLSSSKPIETKNTNMESAKIISDNNTSKGSSVR